MNNKPQIPEDDQILNIKTLRKGSWWLIHDRFWEGSTLKDSFSMEHRDTGNRKTRFAFYPIIKAETIGNVMLGTLPEYTQADYVAMLEEQKSKLQVILAAGRKKK